jgi:hypothetical protein
MQTISTIKGNVSKHISFKSQNPFVLGLKNLVCLQSFFVPTIYLLNNSVKIISCTVSQSIIAEINRSLLVIFIVRSPGTINFITKVLISEISSIYKISITFDQRDY